MFDWFKPKAFALGCVFATLGVLLLIPDATYVIWWGLFWAGVAFALELRDATKTEQE